ncbi:hypothetical protein H6P81_005618 [Aristolochia fimbriata]|uniref:Uncharacterized protein n=1 Tax=Aristolochia fimbriata TaxID=158543 RepID=A0AAV7EVN7_ARIFI|nr:hypothetical protein H6P81_005618 [Aristolochia fimbriata]
MGLDSVLLLSAVLICSLSALWSGPTTILRRRSQSALGSLGCASPWLLLLPLCTVARVGPVGRLEGGGWPWRVGRGLPRPSSVEYLSWSQPDVYARAEAVRSGGFSGTTTKGDRARGLLPTLKFPSPEATRYIAFVGYGTRCKRKSTVYLFRTFGIWIGLRMVGWDTKARDSGERSEEDCRGGRRYRVPRVAERQIGQAVGTGDWGLGSSGHRDLPSLAPGRSADREALILGSSAPGEIPK